jgi:hypothetical protein
MMNKLPRRPLNAGLIVLAAVLAPTAVFAQDAAYAENASNFIGGLVVWLLPVGGAFAVFAMIALDKQAQASRGTTARR